MQKVNVKFVLNFFYEKYPEMDSSVEILALVIFMTTIEV